jgi:hypothetical protein
MIPKQGKPVTEVASYRPISLLPVLLKLFEKTTFEETKPYPGCKADYTVPLIWTSEKPLKDRSGTQNNYLKRIRLWKRSRSAPLFF